MEWWSDGVVGRWEGGERIDYDYDGEDEDEKDDG
jgi:hypothetical protein